MKKLTKVVLTFIAVLHLAACSSPLISVSIDRSQVTMGELKANQEQKKERNEKSNI